MNDSLISKFSLLFKSQLFKIKYFVGYIKHVLVVIFYWWRMVPLTSELPLQGCRVVKSFLCSLTGTKYVLSYIHELQFSTSCNFWKIYCTNRSLILHIFALLMVLEEKKSNKYYFTISLFSLISSFAYCGSSYVIRGYKMGTLARNGLIK